MLTSCQQEDLVKPVLKSEQDGGTPLTSGGTINRTTLAKLLALALQDTEVQDFFQKEATKQFDNDTDVLLALVKDKPFGISSQTLTERLGEINGDAKRIRLLLEADPLATVFVPQITANLSWKEEAPLVAMLDESRTDGKIAVYDQRNLMNEWSAVEVPDRAVVVLKTCERVVLIDSKSARLSENIGRSLGVTADGKGLYLSHSAFDAKEIGSNERSSPYQDDPKIITAHHHHPGNQRDFVYYNIPGGANFHTPAESSASLPGGTNEGYFNSDGYYSEAVVGVQLGNLDTEFAFWNVWADGNAELHLIFFFSKL